MSQKTKERIALIYGLVLSVLIVAVGVCLALSCLSIYRSGDSPFTRESIAAHFERIAIPVCICILGVVGGGVLSLAMPLEKGKIKPRKDPLAILKKNSKKLDLSVCDDSLRNQILGERRFRLGVTVTAGILSGLTLLPAILWCANPAHFSIENLNADIKTAAAFVLPCAAVTMGLWVVAVLLRGASASRESAAARSAAMAKVNATIKISTKGGVRVGNGIPIEVPKKRASSGETARAAVGRFTADPRFVWGVRGAIFVVGAVFVVLGVLNGGMADVLGKAIRICTECIGLG
jgi:hypothetical protein